MNELTEVILEATAAIPEGYFHLQIDGGDPIYRERVYCYELYHQMRLRWPGATEFYLNGEIDKAAHPKLRELGADHVKPDLLVHRPGYMSGNHAAIEVKSSEASRQAIRKDLQNLALFRNHVGYQRAIYLIYGYQASQVIERALRVAQELEDFPEIEFWLHEAPGQAASRNTTLRRSVSNDTG